jgi:hypothetical protein
MNSHRLVSLLVLCISLPTLGGCAVASAPSGEDVAQDEANSETERTIVDERSNPTIENARLNEGLPKQKLSKAALSPKPGDRFEAKRYPILEGAHPYDGHKQGLSKGVLAPGAENNADPDFIPMPDPTPNPVPEELPVLQGR